MITDQNIQLCAVSSDVGAVSRPCLVGGSPGPGTKTTKMCAVHVASPGEHRSHRTCSRFPLPLSIEFRH
jgi:hypothetical protein